MLTELVYAMNFWLHAFPARDGVSASISPKELETGVALDANKHCVVPFGAYVQNHEEHNNAMASRTVGAIALRPTGNAQGGHYFFSLQTGRRKSRNHWTEVPLPADPIARVEQIAEYKALNRLEFGDRQNQPEADDDTAEIQSISSDSEDERDSDDDTDDGHDSDDNDDSRRVAAEEPKGGNGPQAPRHDNHQTIAKNTAAEPAKNPEQRRVMFKAEPAKIPADNGSGSESEWEDAIGGDGDQDVRHTPNTEAHQRHGQLAWSRQITRARARNREHTTMAVEAQG